MAFRKNPISRREPIKSGFRLARFLPRSIPSSSLSNGECGDIGAMGRSYGGALKPLPSHARLDGPPDSSRGSRLEARANAASRTFNPAR